MPDRLMFDRTVAASWDERSRFAWTALTSFGLQATALAVLLILPLLRPAGLPLLRPLSTPVSLGRPFTGRATVTPNAAHSPAPSDPAVFIFHRPSPIPLTNQGPVDDGPPQLPDSGPYRPGPVGSGVPDGVANLPVSGTRPMLPVAPIPVAAGPIRVSHLDEGNLIRRVQPIYPMLARTARIQGPVTLQAVIGKQGSIENLRVLNGPPLLVQAAVDAVRQWRYRPYILNNEPVEVETQIIVNFSLAGN